MGRLCLPFHNEQEEEQLDKTIFALLDAVGDLDSVGSSSLGSPATEKSDGAPKVAESLRECLDAYEFGALAGGKRLTTAMLKWMNHHILMEETKSIPTSNRAANYFCP